MCRILIADDELVECRGLEWTIRNAFPEAEVLPYVQNGIELIRCVEENKPDLLLLDINMPGLSGLEALEIIRMKRLTVRVILVTAYRDFSYAQKAIQLGACDYILKPAQRDRVKAVVEKQLNELRAERRQIEADKKHAEIERRYEKLLVKQLILRLLEDGQKEADDRQTQSDLQQLKITGEESICVVVEEKGGVSIEEEADEILVLLKKGCNAIGYAVRERLYLLLFPEDGVEKTSYRNWCADILEPLLCRINKEKNLSLRAGISGWSYDCSRWRTAFRESCVALYQIESGTLLGYFESQNLPKKQEAYFTFQKTYRKLISQRRYTEGAAALEKFLASCMEENGIRQLRLYSIDLLYTIWELVCSRSLSEDLAGHWKSWKKLLAHSEAAGLSEALSEELLSMVRMPFQKKNYQTYVEDSLRYMREMYRESLSLDDVAQKVGITPFYLSRLFKQEAGQTFLESLTDIRLIRALELVYGGKHTAKEISRSVGYPNSNYFYKIFKKTMGVTLRELKDFAEEKRRYHF